MLRLSDARSEPALGEASKHPTSAMRAMSNDQLYRSLENYLHTGLEVLSGWSQWLAEHERHVLQSDIESLQAHAAGAHALQQELASLSQRRLAVLSAAQSAGFACSTLKQLAQALPQWHADSQFRQRVRKLEQCMANLRRLNTAAWLLVNQCSRVVDTALMLMTSGSALQGAYIDVPHADNRGGHILDAEA